MLIYIVMAGEYSDRGVDAVFTDEKMAKTHLYVAQKKDPDETYDMEVYETSDDNVAFLKKDVEDAMDAVKFGYEFCLLEDGTPKWESSYELLDMNSDDIKGYFDYFGRFVKTVVAKDPSKKEHDRCLKVARDALAKVKAEKEGL